MKNSTKATIIAGILAASVGGGYVGIEREANRLENERIIEEQYQEVKNELVGKYLSGEQLTWQEYQTLIAITDKEVKKQKGIELKNVNEGNLVPKIIHKIIK